MVAYITQFCEGKKSNSIHTKMHSTQISNISPCKIPKVLGDSGVKTSKSQALPLGSPTV